MADEIDELCDHLQLPDLQKPELQSDNDTPSSDHAFRSPFHKFSLRDFPILSLLSLPVEHYLLETNSSRFHLNSGSTYTVDLLQVHRGSPFGNFLDFIRSTWENRKLQIRIGWVVLKQPRRELWREGRTRENVLREVTVLTLPSVRNCADIAQLFFVGWDASFETPFLVMELAQGSLTEVEKAMGRRHCRLDFRLSIRFLFEIASALLVLHSSAIVHGDVKAENVLIFASAMHGLRAKLSDFGSAIFMGQDSQMVNLRGTLTWMAPEALHSETPWLTQPLPAAQLTRAEIYSYGLLMHRTILSFGKDPFEAVAADSFQRTRLTKIFAAKKNNWLTSNIEATVIESCPNPENVWLIMRKCLESDAAKRWADLQDTTDLLQEYVAEAVSFADKAKSYIGRAKKYAIKLKKAIMTAKDDDVPEVAAQDPGGSPSRQRGHIFEPIPSPTNHAILLFLAQLSRGLTFNYERLKNVSSSFWLPFFEELLAFCSGWCPSIPSIEGCDEGIALARLIDTWSPENSSVIIQNILDSWFAARDANLQFVQVGNLLGVLSRRVMEELDLGRRDVALNVSFSLLKAAAALGDVYSVSLVPSMSTYLNSRDLGPIATVFNFILGTIFRAKFATEALSALSQPLFEAVQTLNNRRYFGIGRDLFSDAQMRWLEKMFDKQACPKHTIEAASTQNLSVHQIFINETGLPPLMAFGASNQRKTIENLVACGIDINAAFPSTGDTPLIAACRCASLASVRALLGCAGIDVTASNLYKETALHWLVVCQPLDAEDRCEIAQHLVTMGADPFANANHGTECMNTVDGTPLCRALAFRNTDGVRAMLIVFQTLFEKRQTSSPSSHLRISETRADRDMESGGIKEIILNDLARCIRMASLGLDTASTILILEFIKLHLPDWVAVISTNMLRQFVIEKATAKAKDVLLHWDNHTTLSVEICRILVEFGADPFERDEGEMVSKEDCNDSGGCTWHASALIAAVWAGRWDLIRPMVHMKDGDTLAIAADTLLIFEDKTHKVGRTLLQRSIEIGHRDLYLALRRYQRSEPVLKLVPDTQKNLISHYAAMQKDLFFLQDICTDDTHDKEHIILRAINKEGSTPFERAALNGNLEHMQLIARSWGVNLKEYLSMIADEHNCLGKVTMTYVRGDITHCVDYILEQSESIITKPIYNETVLHALARCPYWSLTTPEKEQYFRLLRHIVGKFRGRPELDQRDRWDISPLSYMVASVNYEGVALLLKAGANPTQREECVTWPLDLALHIQAEGTQYCQFIEPSLGAILYRRDRIVAGRIAYLLRRYGAQSIWYQNFNHEAIDHVIKKNFDYNFHVVPNTVAIYHKNTGKYETLLEGIYDRALSTLRAILFGVKWDDKSLEEDRGHPEQSFQENMFLWPYLIEDKDTSRLKFEHKAPTADEIKAVQKKKWEKQFREHKKLIENSRIPPGGFFDMIKASRR